jgi:Domain of unknown function (DUF6458)
MTFGTSIFVIAVGAILRFAVHVSATGFDIHTIGLILMIVGAAGLLLSLLWLAVWSDRQGERRVIERPETVTRERQRY